MDSMNTILKNQPSDNVYTDFTLSGAWKRFGMDQLSLTIVNSTMDIYWCVEKIQQGPPTFNYSNFKTGHLLTRKYIMRHVSELLMKLRE